MTRRAQASFEYLSTYLYAGVGIIAVVGAMAYFGLFNSNTYIKEQCESGLQLACTDAQVLTNGTISIMLKNNMGRAVNITTYTITDAQELRSSSDSIVTFASGDERVLTITNNRNYTRKDKESITFNFTFHAAESLNDYTIRGVATVGVTLPS